MWPWKTERAVAAGLGASLLPRCDNPYCRAAENLWSRVLRSRTGTRCAGNWYCSPGCLETALVDRFTALCQPPPVPRAVQHRIPLGLLMLARGLITQTQLQAALAAQRAGGSRKVGEWLQEMGAIGEQEITAALGMQWCCPVFNLREGPLPACVELVPRPLLEFYRMVPVHFAPARRDLYVAFSHAVDYGALYALEQMLRCNTRPCLVGASVMERTLDMLRRQRPSSAQRVFDSYTEKAEMARIARGYALKVSATEVRMVRCGDYIWLRLEDHRKPVDLLFRVRNDPLVPVSEWWKQE
jgi:hypothetical protein